MRAHFSLEIRFKDDKSGGLPSSVAQFSRNLASCYELFASLIKDVISAQDLHSYVYWQSPPTIV